MAQIPQSSIVGHFRQVEDPRSTPAAPWDTPPPSPMRRETPRATNMTPATTLSHPPPPRDTAHSTPNNTPGQTTGVITYTYDALSRLTGVNNGAGQQVSYAYDPAGNRTHLLYPDGRVVTYTHSASSGQAYDLANRLAAVDGVSYTFDDNGNLLATGSMTNTWDAANRLTAVSRKPSAVRFRSYR